MHEGLGWPWDKDKLNVYANDSHVEDTASYIGVGSRSMGHAHHFTRLVHDDSV